MIGIPRKTTSDTITRLYMYTEAIASDKSRTLSVLHLVVHSIMVAMPVISQYPNVHIYTAKNM